MSCVERTQAAGAGERDPAPGDGLLRPRHAPKMMFPLVLDLAADRIPVAVTCRVLGFSKQAFYKWKANPVTDRDWDDAHLINAAIDIHHDDPEFGYRFIADELARPRHHRQPQPGQPAVHASSGCGRCTPRSAACTAGPGRRCTTTWSQREFTAAAPNQLWLTDITEHPTAEGKLYLCAIKDACSNRIVGYSIDDRMTAAAGRQRAAQRRRAARPDGARSSTPTAAASSARTPTSRHCRGARAARLDGPGRRLRRQRRHGVVLLPAAEERPQPPTLAHPRANSGWRSSPGSRGPTTAADDKTASAD